MAELAQAIQPMTEPHLDSIVGSVLASGITETPSLKTPEPISISPPEPKVETLGATPMSDSSVKIDAFKTPQLSELPSNISGAVVVSQSSSPQSEETPSGAFGKPRSKKLFGNISKYFCKDNLMCALAVCIVILSTFFKPKAPYVTFKSHKHNLLGVIAIAIILFIAYKYDAAIAIGVAIIYSIAVIVHKFYSRKPKKQVKLEEPPKMIPQTPRDVIPQVYGQDEPIRGVSESDMQSLCAHLHDMKRSPDDIITSADFSELVNTEQACEFAKHQYVNLPPVSRSYTGIAQGINEAAGKPLSELMQSNY